MRNLSLLLLVSLMACSSPQTNSQPALIDTATLFNPNPQMQDKAVDISMFDHCLMIDGDSLAITLNAEKHTLENTKAMKEFVQANTASIMQQRLYIIYANNTPFQKITELIDILKLSKITNYQAIKHQSFIKLNEPAIAE
jgi:hypothetical protein